MSSLDTFWRSLRRNSWMSSQVTEFPQMCICRNQGHYSRRVLAPSSKAKRNNAHVSGRCERISSAINTLFVFLGCCLTQNPDSDEGTLQARGCSLDMSCVSIKTAPSTRSPIEQSDRVHEASLQGMCPTPELGVNGYDPVNENQGEG